MATALKHIERAFSKAGIKPAEEPLTNSEIEDALDCLNDLLSNWDGTGILKGTDPVMNPSDELAVPRYASWAIKSNLALMIAGEYGIQISQALAFDAVNSMNSLLSISLDKSPLPYPSTLPRGSGSDWGFGWRRNFYPEEKENNF